MRPDSGIAERLIVVKEHVAHEARAAESINHDRRRVRQRCGARSGNDCKGAAQAVRGEEQRLRTRGALAKCRQDTIPTVVTASSNAAWRGSGFGRGCKSVTQTSNLAGSLLANVTNVAPWPSAMMTQQLRGGRPVSLSLGMNSSLFNCKPWMALTLVLSTVSKAIRDSYIMNRALSRLNGAVAVKASRALSGYWLRSV